MSAPPPVKPATKKPSWQCQTCNEVNASKATVCQLCHEPKPTSNGMSLTSPFAALSPTASTTTAAFVDHVAQTHGAKPVTMKSSTAVKRTTASSSSTSATRPSPTTTTAVKATTKRLPTTTTPTTAVKPKSSTVVKPTTSSSTTPTSIASLSAPAAIPASVDGDEDAEPDVLQLPKWKCVNCKKVNQPDAIRCVVCVALSPLVSKEALTATESSARIYPKRLPRGQVAVSSSTSSSSTSSFSDAFSDPDFPASDISIYGTPVITVKPVVASGTSTSARRVAPTAPKFGKVEWRRFQQCPTTNQEPWCIVPFKEDGSIDIKPEDIHQGILGDCWFISALSVLAERPHLIENLLLTPELNESGAYQIQFCKNGEWRAITVDDRLPWYGDHFVFSYTNNHAAWIALIEKAYAKLHGSYCAIESGSLYDAFTELTGAPADRIELHVEAMSRYGAFYAAAQKGEKHLHEILWSTILLARASKFLIGASCGRREKDAAYFQAIGLRSDHAYALLDAREVGGLRFLKLRNPWGVDTWTGDYSTNSKKWTNELRTALYFPDAATSSSTSRRTQNNSYGVFWMTFLDFLKYFRTFDVCKYQEGWQSVRLREEFPLQKITAKDVTISGWAGDWMYQLKPTQPTWCFISLIQHDLRGTKATLPFTYKNLGCFLLRNKQNQPLDVASLSSYQRQAECFPESQRTMTCETLLSDTTGSYALLLCSFASTIAKGAPANPSFPFVLSIYSAHPITVTRQPVFKPALTRAIHHAIRIVNRKEVNSACTLYTVGYQGGLFLLVVNRDTQKYVQITCDLSGSTGIFCSRGKNALKLSDLIPPASEQLIYGLVSAKAEGGYGARRKCLTKLIPSAMITPNSIVPPLANVDDIHQPISIDN